MKVAILGTSVGWQDAPWEDGSSEIWALNTQYQLLAPWQIRRVSRWFELHPDNPVTNGRRPPHHWENLDALDVPVYGFHDIPVRRALRFPQDVIDRAPRDYFSCTFAYQIALALSAGVTHLGLYGTPLIGTREALVERPCIEWWMGYAAGRGVETTIEHSEPLGLGRHPYRYAWEDEYERRATYAFVQRHLNYAIHWVAEEVARLNLTPADFVIEER